jgi:hypothetical protein
MMGWVMVLSWALNLLRNSFPNAIFLNHMSSSCVLFICLCHFLYWLIFGNSPCYYHHSLTELYSYHYLFSLHVSILNFVVYFYRQRKTHLTRFLSKSHYKLLKNVFVCEMGRGTYLLNKHTRKMEGHIRVRFKCKAMVVNYFGMDEDICCVEDAKNGRSRRRQSK